MRSTHSPMLALLLIGGAFCTAFAQSPALSHPCADSALYAAETGFWVDAAWEESGGDECDEEESLLFPRVSATTESTRDRNRAAFSVTRNPGAEAKSTLRQQGQSGGWSQRIEVRDDTLTRRRIGWKGAGWKLVVGDLDDPELPLWPPGFPRRTLPIGWRSARRPGSAGHGLSSPLPQGFAAGVLQPRWKAWAARTWNPVETGDEPSWNSAWNLRHVSTGISLSLPWTLTAQFTDTRVARMDTDSLAEHLWVASLASPDEDWNLVGASTGQGWALATTWRHRFARSASLEVTARQRAAAWESSWDPAFTAAAREDSTETWGAGEFRVAGQLPVPHAARTSANLEGWRAWNPPVGTRREGVRGRVNWRGEDARVEITGTHRTARAASGSVSLYRYLEAETLTEANPKFRLSAFRAWNGSGPTRTGFFFGVEPAWGGLRATSGLRVETDAEDDLSAHGSLGARWGFARRWNLDADAAAPCYPRWDSDETRWRVTVNYATTGL